jgi:hypothetical protein
MSSSDTIRHILSHRRLPLFVAALAVLLCISSLWLGLQNDDHVLRLVLSDPPLDPEWTRSPFNAFSFVDGEEELIRRAVEEGRIPWWTHPKLKLAFLRPVTSITHWIDFNVWPDLPWMMHLQSLLWFAGAIIAAALLYRRLLVPAWTAGLAALLFAVDDAHGMPAVWLANRNASIGVFFGLVALIAHDRWRRDGRRPGAFVAPIALLLGLLAGEIALAACGYLLAYALFLDTDTWRGRLASLVPGGFVGIVWWIAYRVMGYGAGGSGVYIDPGANPIEFTGVFVEHLPILLFGQWVLPSGLYLMLSQHAAHILWLVAVALIAVITGLLLPLLKRDRVARFFALGMVLSLVPACATFPDDRLLFFAGFGGMGLLAQLLASVWHRAEWVPRSRIGRLPLQVACWTFVVIHLLFAPLSLATTSNKVRVFGEFIDDAASSLPTDPAITDQLALIVNTPTAFISFYGPLLQALNGRPIPSRTLILGSGIYPTTISRPGPNVIAIRPDGGYLPLPGSPRPGHEASQPAFHPAYIFSMLDHLYRDATPFRVGEEIAYGGATIEIAEITEDGRPVEARFHFQVDLEDPSLRWLQWKGGVYVPLEPPAVGESVTLPSVVVPWQEY